MVNGELALLAALAAHGGRWLRAGAGAGAIVPNLLRGNSSFEFVESFTAEIPPKGPPWRPSEVESPEYWLRALREQGITDLSLITNPPSGGPLPPHIATAFLNSSTSALLATGSSTTPMVWAVDWEVGDRTALNSRIWSLTASAGQGNGFSVPHVGVAEARSRVHRALAEIRAFAEQHDELDSWTSWFKRSEALLDASAPEPPYHQDILPPDAPLDRRQLCAAVVQSWVFGGMGSWNDAYVSDPAARLEYERVSSDLYAALLLALSAAANGA